MVLHRGYADQGVEGQYRETLSVVVHNNTTLWQIVIT